MHQPWPPLRLGPPRPRKTAGPSAAPWPQKQPPQKQETRSDHRPPQSNHEHRHYGRVLGEGLGERPKQETQASQHDKQQRRPAARRSIGARVGWKTEGAVVSEVVSDILVPQNQARNDEPMIFRTQPRQGRQVPGNCRSSAIRNRQSPISLPPARSFVYHNEVTKLTPSTE